jgi:hypothetical protein
MNDHNRRILNICGKTENRCHDQVRMIVREIAVVMRNFPLPINHKQFTTRKFEWVVYDLRFVTGALLSAVFQSQDVLGNVPVAHGDSKFH